MNVMAFSIGPLSLIAFLGLAVQPASATACGAAPAPQVSVVSPRQSVVIDRSRGAAELTAMMADRGASFDEDSTTLGVTDVRYSTSIRMEIQLVVPSLGRPCGYPVSVRVTHGFSEPVRVLLARELRDGSCRFRTTYDHEMQHVRIHQDGLEEARRGIERAIRAEVARAMPVSGGSREEVRERVNEALSRVVETAVRATAEGVERRNAAMDTREAYRALGRLCPDGSP